MWISVDVETTGLDYMSDVLLGLGYWYPSSQKYLTDIKDIKQFFEEHKNDHFIWQNGKFDQKFIKKTCDVWVRNDFDTLLAASLLPDKPDSLSLDNLVAHYLGFPSWKDKEFILDLKNKTIKEQAAYCLTPNHKVLTADLRYVPLGNLCIGDKLLAFDEETKKPHNGRHYTESIVLNIKRNIAECFAVELGTGEIFYTTAEHKWLVGKKPFYWHWMQTKDLLCGTGHSCSHPYKIFPDFNEELSYEAGWLSGFFDGEGTLGARADIAVCQKDNAALSRAKDYLSKLNIPFSIHSHSTSGVFVISILGGVVERIKTLGRLRPIRLLKNLKINELGRMERRNAEATFIKSVTPIGKKEIVEIKTSSSTLIVEGYPMHNCLTDCERTYQLFSLLSKKLNETGNWSFFQNYLIPYSNLLAKVEYSGILIDIEKLKILQEQLLNKINKYDENLRSELKTIISKLEDEKINTYLNKHPKTKSTSEQIRNKKEVRFNFSSPKQRLWLLKDQLNYPCRVIKYDSGIKKIKYSAAKPVIQEYEKPGDVISKILDLEEAIVEEEGVSRYLNFVRSDGKIHTNFNLVNTETGRTSSSNPPLQNVKKGELRSIFIASPGTSFVILDLSQIEFKIAGHYTHDPVMLNAFSNNVDLYAVIANAVLGTNYDPALMKKEHSVVRECGKVIGLSVAYGIGPNKLAADIRRKVKIPCSFSEAQQHIESYFNNFKGLYQGRIDAYQEVLKYGYVETLFGRKVYLTENEARHRAFNYKIQPSASDYCNFIQLWVDKEKNKYGFDANYLLTIHDEVVYEVKTEQAEHFAVLLKTIMTDGWRIYKPELKLTVPITAEVFIGNNWGIK